VRLDELYARYHNRVQFFMIYIREAHPVDGWWLGGGIPGLMLRLSGTKAAMDLYDPRTMEERRAAAGQCQASLEYGIRTYVDEMDDAVNKAYAAWPTRLYLIGLDGRVVYAGGPGPYGFKPSALGEAIAVYLGSQVGEPALGPQTPASAD
jgi:hypothetical protein